MERMECFDAYALRSYVKRKVLPSIARCRFFFSVDTSAIPSEPVLLTVSLDEDAAAKAGYGAKVTSGNVLLYIGGTIDSISQAPTTYNLNNNVTTSEGSNVDMISGANATLNIAYNPTNTHQTGVFWTAIESSDTIQARGLNDGSGSQISLYATEVPVTGCVFAIGNQQKYQKNSALFPKPQFTFFSTI